MRNTITTIIAVSLKIIIGFYWIKYILVFYNSKVEIENQNIWFWILIYIPIFIGYESFIKIIFSKSKNQ